MACGNCNKTCVDAKLKVCAKCLTTEYCSRDCQKKHWKAHKKICVAQAAEARSAPPPEPVLPPDVENENAHRSPPRGLRSFHTDPYTHLHRGTYLFKRPKEDVYALLIDTYRLQLEDTDTPYCPIGIEFDIIEPVNTFRPFLRKAANAGILPSWWDHTHTAECEKRGLSMTEGYFHDLWSWPKPEKFAEFYGEEVFLEQLRMLARLITGISLDGWTQWRAHLEMMAIAETSVREGGPPGWPWNWREAAEPRED